MVKELTEKDIKVLKHEKRIGYVYALLIVSFGGLFNLGYFILNIKHGYNYTMIGFIDIGILLLAYLVCYRINREFNLDIKSNQKNVLKRIVKRKAAGKTYEVGSGTLYIPILGDLFPKLFGLGMKEMSRYFILTKENKYEVDKDMFEKLEEGTEFYVHFAKYSWTILDYTIK